MTNYSRAVGIERAFPSAMVATDATFASVTWAGTGGPGLPQLAARTTRCFRAARARRRQHCHAHRVLIHRSAIVWQALAAAQPPVASFTKFHRSIALFLDGVN